MDACPGCRPRRCTRGRMAAPTARLFRHKVPAKLALSAPQDTRIALGSSHMDRPSPHKREQQRLINRRQQGDLGEASAIDWLTRGGAGVWAPLGHSPDADLLAEVGGRHL